MNFVINALIQKSFDVNDLKSIIIGALKKHGDSLDGETKQFEKEKRCEKRVSINVC